MTMRIYSYLDASAPPLEGVVGGALTGGAYATGSLLELLRQILVAGYGTQTAAGWTMPFTGTSHATFKQGAGCGFYMDVLDDGSLTATAKEASFTGMVTASAVGTGTGLFPTVAQQATGLKFRKSDTADATQRPWFCFADNKTFYLYSFPQYPSGTLYTAGMAFGNFSSFDPTNDAFNCIAIGRVTTALADTITNDPLDQGQYANYNNNTTGHYMAGPYTQLAVSTICGKYYGGLTATAVSGQGNGLPITPVPYPNPVGNGLMVSRALLIDNTTSPIGNIRGWLRGWWALDQNAANMPKGLPLNGTGSLAGKTFKIIGLSGGHGGWYMMETSDTWDS